MKESIKLVQKNALFSSLSQNTCLLVMHRLGNEMIKVIGNQYFSKKKNENVDKKGSAAHIVANNCDTRMTLAPLCIEAGRVAGILTRPARFFQPLRFTVAPDGILL